MYDLSCFSVEGSCSQPPVRSSAVLAPSSCCDTSEYHSHLRAVSCCLSAGTADNNHRAQLTLTLLSSTHVSLRPAALRLCNASVVL